MVLSQVRRFGLVVHAVSETLGMGGFVLPWRIGQRQVVKGLLSQSSNTALRLFSALRHTT